VRLEYTSPDGEEGYPGELAASVTYLLARDAAGEPCADTAAAPPALRTTLRATVTGATTLVNLAQHAYWNLGGHDAGSVLPTHELCMPAAHRYTPVSDALIPTGQLAPVADTPFDFRTPRALGDAAKDAPGGRGYDHNFVLDGPNGAQM
jgi:aldose 1-epimerase